MKPKIAISMGDPGGVGPEVILKALARPGVRDELEPVIVGDISTMSDTARQLGMDLEFPLLDSMDQPFHPDSNSNRIYIHQPAGKCEKPVMGKVASQNGLRSHACIVAAARSALENHVDAICTAPIAKEALFAAGFTVPGHTELLASLCGLKNVRMMLAGGGLNVILQTIHVALKDVPGLLSQEDIITSLHMIRDFAEKAGDSRPRIGVCGLNPHAGESGHFGTEEIDIIAPAIQHVIGDGMNVLGPLPADTVFHRTLQGDFDFVLAMYHDQGLIPVKTLDFHGGVNVTLGLPLLRTSPDHGTAFAIAGKNQADPRSMIAALLYAARLAQKKT